MVRGLRSLQRSGVWAFPVLIEATTAARAAWGCSCCCCGWSFVYYARVKKGGLISGCLSVPRESAPPARSSASDCCTLLHSTPFPLHNRSEGRTKSPAPPPPRASARLGARPPPESPPRRPVPLGFTGRPRTRLRRVLRAPLARGPAARPPPVPAGPLVPLRRGRHDRSTTPMPGGGVPSPPGTPPCQEREGTYRRFCFEIQR